MVERNWFLRAALTAFLCAGTCLGDLAPAPAATQPGFQFWTLQITYENEYCSTHNSPKFPECKGGIARLKGLTLHGLWPTFESGWFVQGRVEFKRPTISDATLDKLRPVMPSVDCHTLAPYDPRHFCLPDRQWELYGIYSGMDPDSYFTAAAALGARFRALPSINGFIAAQSGRSVTVDLLQSALKQDLPGAESRFLCEFKNGRRQYLIEIQIALDLKAFTDFPDPASLHRPFPDYPNASPLGPLHYCPPGEPVEIQ